MSTLPLQAGEAAPVRTDPRVVAHTPAGTWDWWLMGTVVLLAGFVLVQTVAAVGGQEDLVAQGDRTRCAEPRQRRLPDNVLVGTPGGWKPRVVRNTRSVGTAETSPIGSGK